MVTFHLGQPGPSMVAVGATVRARDADGRPVRGWAGVVGATSTDGCWRFAGAADGWRAVYTPTGQTVAGLASLDAARTAAHSGALLAELDEQDRAAAAAVCLGAGECGASSPAGLVVDTARGPQPVCVAHAEALAATGRAARRPGVDPRPTAPLRTTPPR